MKKKILIFLSVICLLALPASAKEKDPVRLPILMYHHMSDKPQLLGTYVLSCHEFEDDLMYLKDNGYESISLSQLLDWYDGKTVLPEKPIMITFDDGYESTAVYAGPLLEKYGYTAIIAVIGSVADTYSETEDHNLDYSHLSWQAFKELNSGSVFELQCHTYDLHHYETRHGCSKLLCEDSYEYEKFLDDDLRLFADACLKNKVKTLPSIAFPYGSYCKDTLSIIKSLGFRAAFTCTEKVNLLYGDKSELFELCRFNRPHGISSEQFFEKLS